MSPPTGRKLSWKNRVLLYGSAVMLDGIFKQHMCHDGYLMHEKQNDLAVKHVESIMNQILSTFLFPESVPSSIMN